MAGVSVSPVIDGISLMRSPSRVGPCRERGARLGLAQPPLRVAQRRNFYVQSLR